jgi:hypothetical protein
MKYSILLDKFKKLGRYHLLLAIVLNLSMIMSFYLILLVSVEQISPIAYCKFDKSFSKCDINTACHLPPENWYIDTSNSVKNWKLQYGLYCENEKYFSYLTSLIFSCDVISILVMSIIADRMGRKFIFRLEVIGNLISFAVLYFEMGLVSIFVAVFINDIFKHLLSTCMLYLYEYFPLNYYYRIMSFHNVIYGFLGLLLTYYAEKYRDVSILTFCMLVNASLVFLFDIFLLAESPDWLLHNIEIHRDNYTYLESLKEDYRFLCRFNGDNAEESLQEFDSDLRKLELLNYEEKPPVQKNFFKFLFEHLHDYNFIKHFMLSIYLWILNQVTFYLTLTNLDKFNMYFDNAYQVFFIAHITSNVLVGSFTHLIGLYNTIKYVTMVTSCFLLIMILVIVDVISLHVYLKYSVFFMFSLLSSFVGESIYLYVPQLFPSKLRSTSSSYTKIPAKIFLALCPLILGNNILVLCFTFAVLAGFSPFVVFICL